MDTLASILVIIGMVLLLIGSLTFLIAAFRESILWGLGVFFISPLSLVFLIVHWRAAKGPFFLWLYGLGFVFGGVFLASGDAPWPLR